MTTPPDYDEAYEQGGEPRPHYRAALEALHSHDLATLGEQLRARTLEREVRYEPDMQGVEVPVWVGFAGLDVVRGADGEFNVLEDNVRMPTELGFAPLAWEGVEDLIGSALPERTPGRGESMERGWGSPTTGSPTSASTP